MTTRVDRMMASAPSYYGEAATYKAIQQAVADECDALADQREDLRKQLRIETATWGLKYWEADLNIKPETNLLYDTVIDKEGTKNLFLNSGLESVTAVGTVLTTSFTNGTMWTPTGTAPTYSASGATFNSASSVIVYSGHQWKPRAGTGGQNLTLVAQVTFTIGTTVQNTNGRVEFRQDANNSHFARLSNTQFMLGKWSSNTNTYKAFVSFTPTAGAQYSIELWMDNTGKVTAKLYSGTISTGTLLQTLAPAGTDTSLAGPYSVAFGCDTGCTVNSATVTAAVPDLFTISTIAGSAIATETTNVNYGGRSVKIVKGASTAYGGQTRPVIAGESYTISAYVLSTSSTVNFAYRAGDGSSTIASATVTPNVWTRASATFVAKITASNSRFEVGYENASAPAGTVCYVDDFQLEQKPHMTELIRNDSLTQPAIRTDVSHLAPSTDPAKMEIRRSRVLSKRRGLGNFSAKLLKSICESFQNAEVNVILDAANYQVTIDFVGRRGLPPNLDDLKVIVADVVHAHMGVSYKINYLVWDEVEATNTNFDRLETFTWDQLEVAYLR